MYLNLCARHCNAIAKASLANVESAAKSKCDLESRFFFGRFDVQALML